MINLYSNKFVLLEILIYRHDWGQCAGGIRCRYIEILYIFTAGGGGTQGGVVWLQISYRSSCVRLRNNDWSHTPCQVRSWSISPAVSEVAVMCGLRSVQYSLFSVRRRVISRQLDDKTLRIH